jgi:hypothetical protein
MFQRKLPLEAVRSRGNFIGKEKSFLHIRDKIYSKEGVE